MSVHKGAAALRSSFACRSRSPVFKRCCSASAAASLPCPCPRSWKSRASPTTRFTKWISAKSSALIHFVNLVDRKSTRLNSSHGYISYAVFCLKKKKYFQKHFLDWHHPNLRQRLSSAR